MVGIQEPLWRAIAVFRFASVGYAAILVLMNRADYSHFAWAWGVIAVMTAWTVVTTYIYSQPSRRGPLTLTVDLAVTAALLLSTAALQHPQSMRQGITPVTATWVAGPVLAWAVYSGRRAGIISALGLSACDFMLRSDRLSVSINGMVLMLLAGAIVGHLARLNAEVEHERQRATEIEAASRERDRLARNIHDSVLQVLALVQRRGAEAGGEAAELGRLAGQQEAALRALVGTAPSHSEPASRARAGRTPAGMVPARARGGGSANGSTRGRGAPPPEAEPERADLRTLLAREESERVTVSTPAEPVWLPRKAVDELVSAVRAALDNVRQHCGDQARAWVLIEDEPEAVTVTIRDNGPGMPRGRLAHAAAAGRLGVSHSIRGRMRDLGGSAHISSMPGEGTEVELRLPRVRQQ